jgi:hypothetical protein
MDPCGDVARGGCDCGGLNWPESLDGAGDLCLDALHLRSTVDWGGAPAGRWQGDSRGSEPRESRL